MDVVTQGLLGGVLAQTAANKREKWPATLAGVFAGLLADADILIRSASDPLLNIEYHRHFTHSLIFIPFGAAIALLILWPFMGRRLGAQRLYLFCLLGFSLSGLLDAFTSYGTQLLWPFSNERIAFSIISIVDPVFTLILLVGLLVGLRLRQRKWALLGLVLCGLYLTLGAVQNHRAQQQAEALAQGRGHAPVQAVVKPTLANLILWRSVYIYQQRIYVDAIRVGLWGRPSVFEGDSVALFQRNSDLPRLDPDSTLYRDIERFNRFSEGFVAFDPRRDDVIGDIRYSMLPHSTKPLWGIVIDTERPQAHADYRFFRDSSRRVRRTFLNMVLGNCAAPSC